MLISLVQLIGVTLPALIGGGIFITTHEKGQKRGRKHTQWYICILFIDIYRRYKR